MALLVAILIALYLIATITHLYTFITGKKLPFYVGIPSLVSGFILHCVILGYFFLSAEVHGWGVWLSVLAWVIVFLYLLVFLRYREMALGGFAVPAAFVLVGYSAAFPRMWGAGSLEVQGYLLMGHALLALLSFGSFFLLFAAALMYVVQAQQLKSRRPGAWLHRFPSLDVLDDLNHKILYFGFTFLTSTLLVGSMWAKSKHGTYWSLDPMRTWPLVVIWVGYGVLLVCRLTRSWKGMRSAIFSMVAFLAVLFALVVHL